MLRGIRVAAGMLAAFAVAVAVLFGAESAAASKYVAIEGAPAAGPKQYDEVFVEKFGSKKAKTVLVLIPGTGGGVGSVAPIARDLSRRVEGLQVWSFDRREQVFEDTSAFEQGDAAAAEDYYLGFHYDKVTAEDVPFVSEWGFATEMNDLHEVIAKASKHGRKVVLGGHSRGGSSVVSYAAWDFEGDGPGYKDLDGIVLIDGGLAAFWPRGLLARGREGATRRDRGRRHVQRPARRRSSRGRADLLRGCGAGRKGGPRRALLAAVESVDRRGRPCASLSGYDEGLLGYLFDKTHSRLGASLQIRARDFGSGDPKPWASGESAPIEDFGKAFSREPGNATEWYYPNRMILDTAAANALEPTPASDFLGLRLFHTEQIDLPLYVFQTELTQGGVIEGANTLIGKSKIKDAKLVDASRTTSHLDPVLAPAKTNRFTKTVEPFLRKIVKSTKKR